MKLSELNTGQCGVIVKVNGHGGFRKRIVEMGFIKGILVESVLNAPLNDPVKYKLMDYEVSLRRAEADLVEIVSKDEADEWYKNNPSEYIGNSEILYSKDSSRLLRCIAEKKSKTINVAFVGNPNCGKTSLFNISGHAHEHVGNYSGVTVDAKKGELDFEGYHFNIIDLPGTYSLTAYTPEELYVRKYIIGQSPDVIINVVDACNLERNLYLTAQLIDMDVPMVMALNMYDEFRETHNEIDITQLGKLLGIPVIPTVGRTGEGVETLLHNIVDIYEGRQTVFRHIHINHGKIIEETIATVEQSIRKNPEPHYNYSGRFLAIKLLENDRQVEVIIRQLPNADEILHVRNLCLRTIQKEYEKESENAITDAKYGFVQGVLRECLVRKNHRTPNRVLTKRIDAIVTNRWCSHVIFLLFMYFMFYCTFAIGQYPMDWIDAGVEWLGITVSQIMHDGTLKDLIVDGIITGVGGVIIFLPNILILYAFISWMEDCGYMARVAFIMDRIMQRMGLHGKSFIPMMMGFGCSIPAIMATRTIEDRKSRLITMLIVPLMSCSARLPVYIIVINAFFPRHQALMLSALYFIGIVMSIFMAKFFSRFIIRGESTPFIMELPPYRLPSVRSVVRHTWDKGFQYLRKMGTTILASSIIVWALSYFPHHDGFTPIQQMEQSYIGQIGQVIEPSIRSCGLTWKEGVSILTGVGAKEIVASSMSILYGGDTLTGLTPLSAISFLVFILLYMPCIVTCITIRHESGKWHWTIFTAIYTTLLAWIVSTLIFQIGQIIFQ